MLRGTKVSTATTAEQPRKRFMFDIEKMDMSKPEIAEILTSTFAGHVPPRNKLNSKMEFPQILDLEVS